MKKEYKIKYYKQEKRGYIKNTNITKRFYPYFLKSNDIYLFKLNKALSEVIEEELVLNLDIESIISIDIPENLKNSFTDKYSRIDSIIIDCSKTVEFLISNTYKIEREKIYKVGEDEIDSIEDFINKIQIILLLEKNFDEEKEMFNHENMTVQRIHYTSNELMII